jgi:hypothetical protein
MERDWDGPMPEGEDNGNLGIEHDTEAESRAEGEGMLSPTERRAIGDEAKRRRKRRSMRASAARRKK